jgi:tetratricopeptide (TPR) repeat protein
MNCKDIERDDMIERYVAGTLADAQRDELEEHYFGCEICFEKLRVCRAAQSVVRKDALAIRAATGSRVRMFPRATWPVVALAAAGFIAFIVLHHSAPAPPVAKYTPPQTTPTQPDPLIAMARFDPPPYKAVAMRDAGSEAQTLFKAAMQNYTEGRFEQAIPGLRAASEKDTQNTAYRFFLGVSSLLASQADAGIGALQTVINEGDTPFLNEAWFYRAKGYLARRDVAAARRDLEHVVSLNRDLVPEAQALLNQLAALK